MPDELEQSWEAFEESLEKEVQRRAAIADKKFQNTLARYKKLMQQAHTQHKIRELAWKGTAVELINNRTCGHECVSMCFQDFNNRFENIESIDQTCLVATCNCENDHHHYTTESSIET